MEKLYFDHKLQGTLIMPDLNSQEWSEAVGFLKAMAHPVRLIILQHLSDGAKCVQVVNQIVNTSQPNLSQHLSILKKAGLVGSHHNGALRCYYLMRPSLVRKVLKELEKDHPEKVRPRDAVIHEGKK